MSKLYYGLWQDLYTLPWPGRLLIEFLIFLLAAFILCKVASKIFQILRLKKVFVKISVLIATKVLSCVGRNREWAHNLDEKVIDWGNRVMSSHFTLSSKLKKILCISVVVVYVLAILPDIPISYYFDEPIITKISMVKNTLEVWESKISFGYLSYVPVFTQSEEEKIYIQIKNLKKKIILYKEPLDKSKKIRKIEQNEKIQYQNQYKKVGKVYWLKVSLPEQNVEGWIKGTTIQKKQLETLTKEE
ncbi:MAG: hypothetical protein J1F02_06325 [Lachnospiraceae bacterium]|nr:hypothetical protein [Lachnospiraceae bacterium]